MNYEFIDYDNIKKCLSLMKNYYGNKDELAVVEYPSNIVLGSEEWLIYIFYSCLLDYGMKSKIYHANLVNTYKMYPNIFNPRYVVDNYDSNRDELLIILKESVHPRYPNVALNKWIDLSNELVKYNSLKDKVTSIGSFEELYSFIRSIGGFGQKTGGLLLRLISDSKLCEFNDEISTIPLDRHDIEICYLNRIIREKKINSKQIDLLSKMLITGGREINLRPSLVDKYLWEIGNTFCNRKDCLNCPLYCNCKTK